MTANPDIINVPIHEPQRSFQQVMSLDSLADTPDSWLGFFQNTSHIAHYKDLLVGATPSPQAHHFRGITQVQSRAADLELAHPDHLIKFTPLYSKSLKDPAWVEKASRARKLPQGISLIYPWHTNYQHYLLEVYPRFELILKLLEVRPSLPIIVPDPLPPFVEESIRFLDITNIIRLDPEESYRFESFFTVSAPGIDFTKVTECAYAFFSRLRKMQKVDPVLPKKIYISRRLLVDGNGIARKLVNEEQVVKLFEKFGFVEIPLEQRPFQEKLSLFYSADIIAGGVGAGMFTGVVCRPETRIVFLEHPVQSTAWHAVPFRDSTSHIARIQCSKLGEGEDPSDENSRWIVDLSVLERALSNDFYVHE